MPDSVPYPVSLLTYISNYGTLDRYSCSTSPTQDLVTASTPVVLSFQPCYQERCIRRAVVHHSSGIWLLDLTLLIMIQSEYSLSKMMTMKK